jgi:hypothetical protein
MIMSMTTLCPKRIARRKAKGKEKARPARGSSNLSQTEDHQDSLSSAQRKRRSAREPGKV